MKTKAEIKKERFENPEKRDKYLNSLKEYSEQISKSLQEHPLKHTCYEEHTCNDFSSNKCKPCGCEPCSLGQQSAELADEAVGVEGIDF